MATLNVRTLLKDFRLEELEHAIKAIKWDIIGLRSGKEIREYSDYIFTISEKNKASTALNSL